jgi:hypothetical protein
MRQVIIQACITARGLQNASQDVRQIDEVRPTRPLIGGEDQWAVSEGGLHSVVPSMGDEVRPDLLSLLPIGVHLLRSVAPAEGVGGGHAHLAGGCDDLLQRLITVWQWPGSDCIGLG